MSLSSVCVALLLSYSPHAPRAPAPHRAVQRASMDEALITAKQLNSLLMASGKIDEAAERYAKEKADGRGR